MVASSLALSGPGSPVSLALPWSTSSWAASTTWPRDVPDPSGSPSPSPSPSSSPGCDAASALYPNSTGDGCLIGTTPATLDPDTLAAIGVPLVLLLLLAVASLVAQLRTST